jgi:hypothetical protein
VRGGVSTRLTLGCGWYEGSEGWSCLDVGRDILRQCTLSRTHITLWQSLEGCINPQLHPAPPVPLSTLVRYMCLDPIPSIIVNCGKFQESQNITTSPVISRVHCLSLHLRVSYQTGNRLEPYINNGLESSRFNTPVLYTK